MIYANREVRADILIVGGATTGLWAAIAARETNPELEVVPVDKATPSKSGCAAFAGGHITCVVPEEDNLEELNCLREGDGLDESWLEFVLKESGERVRRMVEWGVPFEWEASGF